MKSKLCIILGAGASASINSKSPEALDYENFKPVTTKDLFKNSKSFRTVLSHYPLAKSISNDIYIRLESGEQLEAILKDYSHTIERGEDISSTRQFLQVPPYLNELFYNISHFTKQPREYSYLVNRIIGRNDIDVLFLTLNYDVILELLLQELFKVDFDQEIDYINQKRNWKIVKMHGSINWYTQVSKQNEEFYHSEDESRDRIKYLDYLDSRPLKYFSEPTPECIYQKVDHRFIFFWDHNVVYPKISVPVQGNYKLNCPSSHYDFAKKFLSKCKNYLIIGSQGLDEDLLSLLKNHADARYLTIVGRNKDEIDGIKLRFKKSFKSLIGPNIPESYINNFGFSDFIADRKQGLEKFLRIITET